MRTIYPQTGYTEADVTDLFDTRQFSYVECFTIVPKVGDTLRYTSSQIDVTVIPIIGGPGRVTYFANKVLVSGLRYKTGVGVEVDEQTIEIAYGDSNLFQAYLTFPEALKQGRLDGAKIRRDRFFGPKPGGPWIGGIQLFTGRVSTLDNVGRQSASLKIKSDLVLLNVDMPKDLWQPLCKNTWGDGAGCPLDRGTFVVHTTVGAGPMTRSFLPWAGATDDFNMGTAYIEALDSVTRIRTILKVDVGFGVHLIYPIDFDPVLGGDVAYYPNCRRLFENCGDYWPDPESRFIGFPFVPVAETAA